MRKNLLMAASFAAAVSLLGAGCWSASDDAATKTDDGSMMATGTAPTMQGQGVMVGGALMVRNLDIVANAMNANNVTTLVSAVSAAGLVDTLKGPGPFTVFAPTNDAFNKLPAGTVGSLLQPQNKAKLVDILTYHVVSGAYKAADLHDGQMLKTVEGKDLRITARDGKTYVNDVMIDTADVISSNGVTHVIGAVLMPPTTMMK